MTSIQLSQQVYDVSSICSCSNSNCGYNCRNPISDSNQYDFSTDVSNIFTLTDTTITIQPQVIVGVQVTLGGNGSTCSISGLVLKNLFDLLNPSSKSIQVFHGCGFVGNCDNNSNVETVLFSNINGFDTTWCASGLFFGVWNAVSFWGFNLIQPFQNNLVNSEALGSTQQIYIAGSSSSVYCNTCYNGLQSKFTCTIPDPSSTYSKYPAIWTLQGFTAIGKDTSSCAPDTGSNGGVDLFTKLTYQNVGPFVGAYMTMINSSVSNTTGSSGLCCIEEQYGGYMPGTPENIACLMYPNNPLTTNPSSTTGCDNLLLGTTGYCAHNYANPKITNTALCSTLLDTICYNYCNSTNTNCDTAIQTWCAAQTNGGINLPECACFLSNQFYQNYYDSLVTQVNGLSTTVPNSPWCTFNQCVTSTLGCPTPYNLKNSVNTQCPNIANCVMDSQVNNDGTINGSVSLSSDSTCSSYELKLYACQNGTCQLNAEGEGSSDPTCGGGCKQFTYYCNNKQCVQDPNGILGTTSPTCNGGCAQSSTKQITYYCNNQQCVQDPNGILGTTSPTCNGECAQSVTNSKSSSKTIYIIIGVVVVIIIIIILLL
jgi:hypothetical protein